MLHVERELRCKPQDREQKIDLTVWEGEVSPVEELCPGPHLKTVSSLLDLSLDTLTLPAVLQRRSMVSVDLLYCFVTSLSSKQLAFTDSC